MYLTRDGKFSRRPVGLWLCGVALLAACGGGGPTDPTPGDPTVTPPGTPAGSPVTQTVGPAGGTLQTPDGKIRITFPAGALSANTAFTLQPLTHALPGGLGPAYELSPQNVTLAQPLQIRLQLPEADQAGASDSQGVALQDDSGAWFALGGAQVQTAGVGAARVSSITVQLRRLNRGTRLIKAIGAYADFRLNPPSASVRKGQSLTLDISACEPRPPAVPPAAGEDDLAPIACGSPIRNASGLRAGAGQLSQVSPSRLRYTAPGQTPSPNPVTLTVTYDAVAGRARVILLGSVRVVGDIGRYSGRVTYRVPSEVGALYVGTADLTYELFDQLDPLGPRYRLVGGSFTMTINPSISGVTCPSREVTVPARTGESGGVLNVFLEGSPGGKTHGISFSAQDLFLTFDCRDDRDGSAVQLQANAGFGLFTPNNSVPYTEETTLAATDVAMAGFGPTASWRLLGE